MKVEKKENLLIWIYGILLLLQALNFENQYAAIFALCGVLALANIFLKRQPTYFSKPFILIVLFSTGALITLLLWNEPLKTLMFHYFLFPIIAYFIGIFIAYCNKKNPENGEHLLGFIILGEFIYGMLPIINYWKRHGGLWFSTRYDFNDVWTNTYISATKLSLLMTPFACLFFYFLVTKKQLLYKISGCVITFSIIVINFLFGNRLVVLCSVLAVIIASIAYSFMIRGRQQHRKFLKCLSITGACIAIAALVFNKQITAQFLKSEMFTRLQGSSDFFKTGRTTLYLDFWKQFLSYPFGGEKMEMSVNDGYFHNIFFDTYNLMGLFPTLILISIFVVLFRYLYQNYKHRTFANEKIAAYFCILLGVIFSFQVEPVMQGDIYLFYYVIISLGYFEYSDYIQVKKIHENNICVKLPFPSSAAVFNCNGRENRR